MTPDIGHFALTLALSFSLLQWLAPLYGYRRHSIFFHLSTAAALAQFALLALAMLCLILSFVTNDMSVIYVQEHSHALLPLIYRMGAAWGGHEGSLLLWCLILSGWTTAFILCRGVFIAAEVSTQRGVIAILGCISSGFIIFLLFTSNPFLRTFPIDPIAGNDLTPVLQDPGLIFHPPMLYLGYVGFAIGFAFAVCALLEGHFSKNWAAACRPWVILPWAFLSCGIVLGSWWAYRELGWGGWWFWDPVENASLLPWLSATAFIHTLLVSEKRDAFKGWTILLAIVTFALSLIGTFLVRSGVLVSVHTFASDPTRGLFLLCYLICIIGGALALYSIRINNFSPAPKFELLSRETFLMTNSVILLTAVATILLGTLYPIILEALDLEKISVGEPYFNTVFLPIILPLLLLMGFAPHISWGTHSLKKLWHTLRLNILTSALAGFLGPWAFGFDFHFFASLGGCIAAWLMLATMQYAYRVKHLHLQQWAMIVAHLGIAVLALGITVNKSYSQERQVKIHVGESVELAGYQFHLQQLDETQGSNFNTTRATFDVTKPKTPPKTLSAEERIYLSHEQTLSKPGILANAYCDLYLALGNTFPDGSWSIRIYYKPLVRWIWAGGLMLLLGGLLSLFSSINRRQSA